MNRTEPLLSQDWYRIAFMRPRLRSGVNVSRQRVRGEIWYVLSDPVSGRHHRFNGTAFKLIGACRGHSTIDEIWARNLAESGDKAPSQAQAIAIFSQAFSANLFADSAEPDAVAVIKSNAKRTRRKRRASMNPLAFRVPLWDPERFLSRFADRLAWCFSSKFKVLAALIIALGTGLLALNASEFIAFSKRELGNGQMLFAMWLVYPIIKALHELAHAVAIKINGGEVHEMGITVLMLTPVPYVDASDSIAFSDKQRRIDVAAAGIVTEALLASVALLFWMSTEPGFLNDIAFSCVFIGAISTLLVNGNPLLRFDGYYVFCDFLELPNLGTRSARYWQYAIKRWVLRLRNVRFGGAARGEVKWLFAYAPLSWCYRVVLLSTLTLLAANWNVLLGIVVLTLALWMLAIKPILAVLRWIASSGEIHGQRPRAVLATVVSVFCIGLVSLGIPLPHRTQAPAVVWLPDNAMVRLGTEGFIEEYLVRDGQPVQVGTLIARLRNDALNTELSSVQAQLAQWRVEQAKHFNTDAQRVATLGDEIQQLSARQAQLNNQAQELLVRAQVAGRVVLDLAQIPVGRFLSQGELVAHVLPGGASMVRALVHNTDIDLVRKSPNTVRVRLAHAGSNPLTASVIDTQPKASKTLPTPALGQAAGGSVVLDPSDTQGVTAREAYFQVDLKLDDGAISTHIGSRALVTFNHGKSTAVGLVGRQIRRSFLSNFKL